MPKSAAYLTAEQIAEIRANNANIWNGIDPTYINLLDRLLCDVSEDSIPEPEKGRIFLLIRQLYRKLEKYSA